MGEIAGKWWADDVVQVEKKYARDGENLKWRERGG